MRVLVVEEQQLSTGSSQDNQTTPLIQRAASPPHYFLPQTLRNWPWPRKISPHYRSCQDECAAWFENFKPSRQVQAAFNKWDFALLAALTFPHSSHFNLRSCSEMMYTFYMIDETTIGLPTDVATKRCEAIMDAMLHVDKPRPEGENVVGEITRQFWKRASSEMPRVVIERFETVWQRYLDAVIRHTQHRSQGYICTPDEYMVARLDDIGAYPCFAIMEQTLGLELPHKVMEHPNIQLLNKYACEMILLDNDMASYKKEFLGDDADYNVVTVAQKHLGRDLDGAFQWLLECHDQSVVNFLALREKVLKKDGFPSYGPHIDREVADYIDGLGEWIRGHDEWNFGSGRFFGYDGLQVQKHRKVVLA